MFAFIKIRLCCSIRLQESDTVDTCSDILSRYVAARILGKVYCLNYVASVSFVGSLLLQFTRCFRTLLLEV